MGTRAVAAHELASLVGVFSHPARLRIAVELRAGEQDVATLRAVVGATPSAISQHLATLRAHRVVVERRDGRRVVYRLTDPRVATWLLDGLRLVEAELGEADRIRSAVAEARTLWTKRARGGRP